MGKNTNYHDVSRVRGGTRLIHSGRLREGNALDQVSSPNGATGPPSGYRCGQTPPGRLLQCIPARLDREYME